MARYTVPLPYDVLCVVASFISSHQDLVAFCSANRATHSAGIPFLYRDVFFETWPDVRSDDVIPSGGWYRVSDPTEELMRLLNRDLQNDPNLQARANHVRSLRHLTVTEDSGRQNDRTQDMPQNELVYLVETLPQLQELLVSVNDLVIPFLETAISNSTISTLRLTPHRILTQSCQSLRIAQDSQNFLPLWGNIHSPLLKSLTITDLPPSCRTYLDRYTVPGSVEIWNIITHCPSLQHLDIRVKISGRDRGHNHINDIGRRSTLSKNVASQPVVHLRTLRLQNCSVSGFEFNRLDPETMEELHIPYNGRKRLFRDLVSGPLVVSHSMAFPRNLKSLVVDTLPLTPDRREPWQEVFDKNFAELQLEELIVLTRKVDFWLQSTTSFAGAGSWVSRNGDDLSPNTRNVAVEMIIGHKMDDGGRNTSGSAAVPSDVSTVTSPTDPSTDAAIIDADDQVASMANMDLADIEVPPTPAMGRWLKRLLLKGSWQMTRSLLDNLLTTCWDLEELGVALLWKEWNHDISEIPPCIKRLRHLRALIILNEPHSKNMNPEWGSPLPTRNKVWQTPLALDDDAFLQHGQPQERLRYLGIGKKMWSVVLEDHDERDERLGRYNRYRGSQKHVSKGNGKGDYRWRRTLREVDRESVAGVGILEWIRFCDECWVNDFSDKTNG
ncbi:hypothetical protein Dda_8292 [Drechslerella dactyloides]|uniref:Uncharacterized protein n=1 Tax=Drechslerella dactyloides TaxID=74499 RepID=A0AAD6IRQ1_DREDA|nr:hypothetical protein Dda_8292 [Drechslerella dactyloides]